MKIRKIYYLLLSLVLTVGCEDAIDINQPGRLDADRAFQTVEDLSLGLNGVYDGVDLTPEILFNAIFTDELAIGIENGGQQIGLYSLVLNPSSAITNNFWTRNYDLLNAANRLIEAGDIVEAADAAEQSLKDEILGQAYFLRAWGHFELLSYYSTDYADDSALAAILVDFVPTIDQLLLRSTNADFYELIENDLDLAESLLSDDTSDPTTINKDVIDAFRARVAAYRGPAHYAEAAGYAQELLNKYPLATRAQYQGIFQDVDNTEVIFKLERTIGDNYDNQGTGGTAGGHAGGIFSFSAATRTGGAFLEVGRSLFNALDPDDIRYDVLVAPDSDIDPDYEVNNNPTLDVLVVYKYPGSEGVTNMNDLKVFRSAEMLLILAEAWVEIGDLNGATNSVAALIKQLRDARFGTDTALPVFANKTEAYGAILDERRFEFAFEGHRWKDLKRMGLRGNRQVSRDAIDCAIVNQCSLSPDNYRFTFPIPQIEFNANPDLRTQQNPGY
ncbi:RagB/SusD family nutrient uptake outer membrane protein [Lentiprolixibacter aurantiacus]|uniref:RagB/SusD family nutrient uptake outer membrane protein n=1 Tax=Lentiprolixibacter aurantiacus TaxID=2993939 RepID=A0AAE3MIC9_9FLAO|nr:RagB/SusD family nutrient uptake outer membrane protein [Lentiprolixibacter aurantiacus]MCX2717973.1 RagB/SusD family nutrient uptake outer membrane protein [Lentiprolixibacter aurantiacus]